MNKPFNLPLVTVGSSDIAADQLEALHRACKDHGFFLLSNELPNGGHHISPDLIERMWQVGRELFDADIAEKMAVSVSTSDANRGYFSNIDHTEFNKDPSGHKIKDNKEGFFFGSDTLIKPQSNRVPSGKEGLLPQVEEYMTQARRVCISVMRAIVCTGLLTALNPDEADPDVFINKYLNDPVYMLKVLKYPALMGNTDAHTDYGCVTLLLPGDAGLQVYFDGAYHQVPLVPNAFVVNFGDLLQFWSGGKIKSTIHRVIYNSPSGRPRYSIPFFLHPSRGSTIHGGEGVENIDSYSYVLSKFDATYKHRQKAKADTTANADGASAV